MGAWSTVAAAVHPPLLPPSPSPSPPPPPNSRTPSIPVRKTANDLRSDLYITIHILPQPTACRFWASRRVHHAACLPACLLAAARMHACKRHATRQPALPRPAWVAPQGAAVRSMLAPPHLPVICTLQPPRHAHTERKARAPQPQRALPAHIREPVRGREVAQQQQQGPLFFWSWGQLLRILLGRPGRVFYWACCVRAM